MSKIKHRAVVSNNIKTKEPEITPQENLQNPIFCFKYLDKKKYGLDHCDTNDKKQLIEQIVKLSQMSWTEIYMADRHGLGTEKIPVNILRHPCPEFITKDVDFLLAFRYNGKKPFVGFRNKNLFHIIFIDHDFTLYDHS